MTLESEIKAYALKNRLEYGKAEPSKVLPKLFNHGLERKDIGKIMPKIQEVVKEVNGLEDKEADKEYGMFAKFVKEKEEDSGDLKELPGIVKGKKPVFRAAPFPSGAIHVGNAKTFVLNALYAEKYGGKMILVMDDTIGSAEKPIEKEAYSLIENAFDWLGIDYGGKKKIIYKSDRLKTYYEYAEKLIKKDKAYVCHCSQADFKKFKDSGKDCSCRHFPEEEQMERWKEMFKAKEGKAVLRLKTSMQHKNPAFRDRVLFKISDREHVKVKKKYRVWPTLEMSWAIDDHLLGMTHIIRGNDLLIETEMENFIWDIFSWKAPEVIHTGLVRIDGIEGAKISKSKAAAEVKSGEFTGWDDPRTWSIQSLERRGIEPEAFREFVKEIGLNKQDTSVPIENLYAINRRLLDKDALRYSFVESPKKISVNGAPALDRVCVKIHPEKEEKREVILGKSEFYISGKDFEESLGKDVRLLNLYNVKFDKKGSSEFAGDELRKNQKINWVSSESKVKARVLMPNGKWVSGVAESAIEEIEAGQVVQFERFGFVRFDRVIEEKGKEIYEFWFGHK